MRLPVFAHNSNPAVDRFLVKKSVSYVADLVSSRAADWIDNSDHSRGCILRGRFLVRDRHDEHMSRAAGSGFDSAWSIRMSGIAGPLVWQLKTTSALLA